MDPAVELDVGAHLEATLDFSVLVKLVFFSTGAGDDEDEVEVELVVLSLLNENFLTSSGLGLGDSTGGFFPPSSTLFANALLILREAGVALGCCGPLK